MLHLFLYEKGTESPEWINCKHKKGQRGRNSQGREEDKDGNLRRKWLRVRGYRKERERTLDFIVKKRELIDLRAAEISGRSLEQDLKANASGKRWYKITWTFGGFSGTLLHDRVCESHRKHDWSELIRQAGIKCGQSHSWNKNGQWLSKVSS